MAERDRSSDQRAHAGSRNQIDGDPGLSKRLYHANMRESASPAAGEHQTDCLPQHKPRHARDIASIAEPNMKDAVARKPLQPLGAAAGQDAFSIVDQD